MSSTSFQIVYDGPALESSKFNARTLSEALLAFDDLFKQSDAILNHGRTTSALEVEGSFQTGSFKINFHQSIGLIEAAKNLLNSDEATAILNAASLTHLIFGSGGLIALLVWLKGKKPSRVEIFKDGTASVFRNDQMFQTEEKVIKLFRDHLIQKALKDAIQKPLSREGIDDFGVVVKNKTLIHVSKTDSAYLTTDSSQEQVIQDTQRETVLYIVSPSFKKLDKWRVNEGGANYYTSIEDEDFWEKITSNEVEFKASTTLRVMLNEVIFQSSDGTLRKESVISKVLDIIPPPEQIEFYMK